MTREQAIKLNDELTEITGVKHYPSVGEMLEAKFQEKELHDDNGNAIKRKEKKE